MKTPNAVILFTTTATTAVSGFTIQSHNLETSSRIRTSSTRTTTTALNGLFDGVKEAFSAPPSQLGSERETPIDRWMGWSVVSENTPVEVSNPTDFVDSMDEKNYIAVELTKPMGIVFEENDAEFGGIFIQSLKDGGAAAALDGLLKPGDQLVVVGTKNVSGLDFDSSLGAIIESEGEKTKLTLFRGTAKQFYGPTGPSRDWLTAFCEKGGVGLSH